MVPDDEVVSRDVVFDNPEVLHSKRRNVYRRRWYIAFLFALFAMEQGSVSNTWGPVSDTVSIVYGWSTTTVAILSMWNNLIFLIAFIPMVKFMISKGLRVTTLSCTLAMAISTGIRCLPANSKILKILAHISSILCGYSNTLGMIGPTAVSVTWFPAHERNLATAIVSVSNNNLANGMSFLLAKVFVRDFNDSKEYNISISKSEKDLHTSLMKRDLNDFMLAEFTLCLFVFIAVVIYFPGRPHNPPSSSAATERISYRRSILKVIRLKNAWLVLIPYALPLGIQPAFMTVMDPILKNYGIDQDNSDWIGFYSAVASALSGLLLSWMADRLRRQTKCLVIIAIGLGGFCYSWFLFIGYNLLPASKVCIYLSLILGGVFSNGAVPLLYELACELTYPVSEEVTTGFITAANNLIAVIFLGAVSIKSLGENWVMWCLVGTFWISIPVLIAVRPEYRRMDIDCNHSSRNESSETSDMSNILYSVNFQ